MVQHAAVQQRGGSGVLDVVHFVSYSIQVVIHQQNALVIITYTVHSHMDWVSDNLKYNKVFGSYFFQNYMLLSLTKWQTWLHCKQLMFCGWFQGILLQF